MKNLFRLLLVVMTTNLFAQGTAEKNVMAMTHLTALNVPTGRVITTVGINNAGYLTISDILAEAVSTTPVTIVGSLPSTGNGVYAGKLIIENFVSGVNEVISCFVDKTGKRWSLPTIPATTNTFAANSSNFVSTVNGITATLTPATGIISSTLGFNGSGVLVKQAITTPFVALNGDVVSTSTGGVTTIQPGVVDNGKLANAAVTGAKIAPMSATTGQALVYNGTTWTPATISGGSEGTTVSTYDAGNGCTVVATGTGVTFTRNTVATWTLSIPTGVRVISFKIYTASASFFGGNVQITFDYTGNTLTNTSFATAEPPRTTLWGDTSSAWIDYSTGGALTANWRGTITSAASGDIVMSYVPPTGVSGGNTLITGNF